MDNNHKFESNKKYFTICVYTLFVILIGSLIVKVVLDWDTVLLQLRKFVDTLSPFLAGAFIAYLINPLMNRLYKDVFQSRLKIKSEKVCKMLSIFIAYLVVFTFIGLCLFYIIPQIVKSITDLIQVLPTFYGEIYKFITGLEEKYPQLNLTSLNEMAENLIPDLTMYLKNLVTNVIPVIYTTSLSVIRWAFNAIIALIVSCYMLSDKKVLIRNFKRLLYAVLQKRRADFLIVTLKESNGIFSRFIIGKSIDSFIIGVLCFLSMSLLRLPYALLISAIVGVTNMIPYFGPFIGCVPGFLLLILLSPVKAVIFLILILVLQQFDGLVLGPKILGDSTGLRPLWIIFAITIGGSLGGVLGMFFGVPVVAVIAYLADRVIKSSLKNKDIRIE